MEGRQPAVLAGSITSFLLATIAVALRFISRIFVAKKVALNDYLMLAAWLIDFGFSFSLFYATRKGLGLHSRNIPPENMLALIRADYAFTVLYNPALVTAKSSILAFYLTLARGETFFRRSTYWTLAVVVLTGIAMTLINVFQCTPASAAFRSATPLTSAKCFDILTLYLSFSPVNIITDLAILVLPMPTLTKMHLPWKQKLTLVVIFGFGFFVAVIDVIRIAFFEQAAISSQLALKVLHVSSIRALDFNWYASLSFMWSVVEVNVVVICGCVPMLKPLVTRLLPRLIKHTDSASPAPSTARHGPLESPLVMPPLAAVGGLSSSRRSSSLPISQGSNPSNENDSTGRIMCRRNYNSDFLDSLNHPEPGPRDAEAYATHGDPYSEMMSTDFASTSNPKSMLRLSNMESIGPNALITLLFFMWGFAYGFLGVLNAEFQNISQLGAWYSLGLHGAYFGGYAISPLLVGRPVLNSWGFKPTFITGLCIYGCGTLIFWPSAVLMSAAAFIVSNFIVGCGLAVLETAANPFISLCGPPENAEIRLNISQGIQAIGTVLSPLLAKKVLFKSVTDVASLVNVQWAYLGIALFDVLLAVGFYYLPIPEASNDDLEELPNHRRDDNMTKVAGIPVVWLTLALGVWSQFFYVAGQEVLSTSLEKFVIYAQPNSSLEPFEYLTIAHAVFAIGRFLTALTLLMLRPRWFLLISYIGLIVFSVLCMKTTGSAAVAMAMVVFLFESGVFSTIFALSLRGTGPHTKTAASILAAAISGGVYFPFAQRAAYLAHSMSYSFCVLVALFSAGAVFPAYLNLVPAARKQVDPWPNEYLRRRWRRRS